MSDSNKKEIKIDPRFKSLIRPLLKDEYQQLEQNLLVDGCLNPIILWKGTIVDGHNRYEICTRLGIEFETQEMDFESDEDVIAWICSNQLGRRNISDETRKYLIGKRYEAEKIIGYRRNTQGWNQYMSDEESTQLPYEVFDAGKMRQRAQSARYRTAERLGDAYHISHCTVEKYGQYSKALDEIGRKEPELVPKILSGRLRISHENVVDLSKKTPVEVRRFSRQMRNTHNDDGYITYRDSRGHFIPNPQAKSERMPVVLQPSVKDMPEYDPDAEITGLTLTIPSWASTIERTKSKADLSAVSSDARAKLGEALKELQTTVNEMMEAIKEN